jgi:hypothetical protein
MDDKERAAQWIIYLWKTSMIQRRIKIWSLRYLEIAIWYSCKCVGIQLICSISLERVLCAWPLCYSIMNFPPSLRDKQATRAQVMFIVFCFIQFYIHVELCCFILFYIYTL